MSDRRASGAQVLMFAVGCLVLLVLLSGLLVGGCAGVKAFQRAQKRADANNNVKVTSINIRRAQQQARVVHAQNAAVQARAEQRLIEAVGIRKAQDEISATLTDRYLQHEAIKAQEKMASGQNHTTVYIPSGEMGVPLTGTFSAAKGK
jgi:uncharacterized iron-regulated membrane protein